MKTCIINLNLIVMGQGLSPARARPEARVFWPAWSPSSGEGPRPSEKPGGSKGSKNIIFFWKKCIIIHLLMSKLMKSKIQIISYFFQYIGKLARPFYFFFKYFDAIYINLDEFWEQETLLLKRVRFKGPKPGPARSPVLEEGLKPGPGPGPRFQGPGLARDRLFRARPITN